LTERQKEVASWLGEGLTDGEIAARLEIGLHTVKAHVSELLERTSTPGRGRLQAWIWRDRMASEFARRVPGKPVKYK
jgi:DNA-binding CsgD family transcriptional regulator